MAIYGQAIYGQAVYRSATAPAPPSHPMASMSIEKLNGYSIEVEAWLNKYKPQLIAGKYDPSTDITPMDAERTAIAAANRNQEEKKSQLKIATQTLNELASAAEASIGQKLDRGIAAAGKKSAIGQEGLEIRARLHRQPSKAKKPTA
jgi:hypothetical protein